MNYSQNLLETTEKMNLQKEVFYQEYLHRENEILHAPYNPELEFYSLVQSGEVEKVRVHCELSPLIEKEGLGKLSDNHLRNIKYHFVITTALVARYCIEGGMAMTTAYTLSDFYIKKADEATSAEAVSSLHPKMCIDYTRRMKDLKKQKVCSQHIVKALDYIYDHLHTKITVPVLADHIGIHPSYLSRLFKKETGYSITDYVQNKKVETAKNMLIYSEYTPAQIANILAFPNQSYFTELFRKKTGITPYKYRCQNLRKIGVSKK